VDQHVPAFAERNECDTVEADQIIQQRIIVVSVVHQQVIAQTKRDSIKQESMYFQALGSLLPECQEQPQKDIEDIKSDRGHHPYQ